MVPMAVPPPLSPLGEGHAEPADGCVTPLRVAGGAPSSPVAGLGRVGAHIPEEGRPASSTSSSVLDATCNELVSCCTPGPCGATILSETGCVLQAVNSLPRAGEEMMCMVAAPQWCQVRLRLKGLMMMPAPDKFTALSM